MRIFRCNFAKFSRGHAAGPPRIVVLSALPLKLICDVTRLLQKFASPPGNFLRTPLLFDIQSLNLQAMQKRFNCVESTAQTRVV